MPNRMLRDWTNSDKVDVISTQAEVFFTRLIMKADDYGCFYADTRLLKANLFPLKLDKIREADLTRWMTECQKAGLIVLYEVNQKQYLQIHDFRQRLDKAKAKFPLPPEKEDIDDFPEVVNDFPPESETELNQKPNTKKNGAKALVAAGAATVLSDQEQRKKYKSLIDGLKGKETKDVWLAIKQFVSEESPEFVEPYVDAWNIFALSYKLSSVASISKSRRDKFSTRAKEEPFKFLSILEKIKTSPHLKGDNDRSWKVTFDWILENDKNYLKILEGNYN